MDFRDHKDFISSDPVSREMILSDFAGATCNGVVLSRDQLKWLGNLYPITNPTNTGSCVQFHSAIDTRDLLRLVQRDGLRVMAVLAKFCDAGADPVKVLVQLLWNQGYDVGDLVEWAAEEEG